MPSSYQQRVNENNELIRKNKLLQEELNKMRNAIAILNNSIFRMDSITGHNDIDLTLQFDELCKEMEEDKLLND
jgi:predicted nuclease with TOPRIM domain